jgi:hypothetical protein
MREATVDEIEHAAQAIAGLDRYLAAELASIAEGLADENEDSERAGFRAKLTPTSLRSLAQRIHDELRT